MSLSGTSRRLKEDFVHPSVYQGFQLVSSAGFGMHGGQLGHIIKQLRVASFSLVCVVPAEALRSSQWILLNATSLTGEISRELRGNMFTALKINVPLSLTYIPVTCSIGQSSHLTVALPCSSTSSLRERLSSSFRNGFGKKSRNLSSLFLNHQK